MSKSTAFLGVIFHPPTPTQSQPKEMSLTGAKNSKGKVVATSPIGFVITVEDTVKEKRPFGPVHSLFVPGQLLLN